MARRRPRLPSITSLLKRAQRLWGDVLLSVNRAAHGGRCRVCNDRQAVDPHHVFEKKRYGWLRFDLRVGLPVCKECHLAASHDPIPAVSAWLRFKGDAQMMADFVREKEARKDPNRKTRRGFTWKRADVVLVIQRLERALDVAHTVEGSR